MTMFYDTIKKTDLQLKTDVLSELEYEPYVKVSDIGVLVKDGTVTLNGYATSYSEKMEAVRAVKRIAGVKAIADDIEVQLMNTMHHTDTDIAAAAARQIESSKLIPTDSIEITVREGRVILDGEVEWQYQKNAAGIAVEHLVGIKEISNFILVKPKLTATSVEKTIESAFKRNALLDAHKIHVETHGNKVILRGDVRNFAELEEAERIAWAAPGVFMVDNHLTVNWIVAESR